MWYLLRSFDQYETNQLAGALCWGDGQTKIRVCSDDAFFGSIIWHCKAPSPLILPGKGCCSMVCI